MAIALVTGQFASATGTSATPQASLPSAATANNLLVAIVGCNSTTASMTAANGFTKVNETDSTDRSALFYKVAAGGEQTNINPVTLGASRDFAIVIAEFSGCATSSPLDASNANADNDATKTLTASLDPSIDGQEGLVIGAAMAIGANRTWSSEKVNGSTTGVTEIAEGGAGGVSNSVVLFYKVETIASGAYTTEAVCSTSEAGTIFGAIFKPASGTNGTISAGLMTATAAALASTLSGGASITAGLMTATAAAPAATLTGGATLTAEAMTATAASPAATMTGGATLTAEAMTASAASPAAALSGGATLAAEAMTATAAMPAAVLGVANGIAAGVMTATAASLAAVLSGGASLVAGALQATAALLTAVLSGDMGVVTPAKRVTVDALDLGMTVDALTAVRVDALDVTLVVEGER